ncbi:MAG: outer membrane lipoprotein carrier protein LolA [Prevotellaceae bacterium]|nr:outer membrane lipoprotein carrier protein LolA [Prevotellaceae bacterium]
MSKLFKLLVVALLSALCVPADGQILKNADSLIIEKIRQANAQYTALTSNFKQIKHLPYLKEKVVSTGKFFYAKPDRLAMKYLEPAGDMMLINGDKFFMSAAGKISKTTAKANAKMRKMKSILSACLQGDVKQMEYAAITCEEHPDRYSVAVELDDKGKGKGGTVRKVTVDYDRSDFTPSNLKIEEADGTYSLYELSSKEFNRPPAEDVFKAPEKTKEKQ